MPADHWKLPRYAVLSPQTMAAVRLEQTEAPLESQVHPAIRTAHAHSRHRVDDQPESIHACQRRVPLVGADPRRAQRERRDILGIPAAPTLRPRMQLPHRIVHCGSKPACTMTWPDSRISKGCDRSQPSSSCDQGQSEFHLGYRLCVATLPHTPHRADEGRDCPAPPAQHPPMSEPAAGRPTSPARDSPDHPVNQTRSVAGVKRIRASNNFSASTLPAGSPMA